MFGGKIMGVPEGNIGKVMGKTATDTFNFGGSNSKFFYVVKVYVSRPGSFPDIEDERFYRINLGHNVRRKKNGDYDPSGTNPSGSIFEGIVDDDGGIVNRGFYIVDCYGIVSPDRTATYLQFSSSEVSVTPTIYVTNAIDLYLPAPIGLVNLANQLNAANDENETDAVSGFTFNGTSGHLTSTSSGVITGTYSIKYNMLDSNGANQLHYDITDCEIGARYRIMFKARYDTQPNPRPRIENWQGIETQIPVTNLTSYDKEYVYDVVASATTIQIRLYPLQLGTIIIFDSLEIYKNVPILESPLVLPSLVSLWDETSIDVTATIEGDDISIWNDIGGGTNDATQSLTLRPKLHINSVNGDREVRFDGSNDWLNVGKPANLGFLPNVDAISCVVRVGESISSQGYYISKASSTSSTRNYGFFDSSGTANIALVYGGTSAFSNTAPTSGGLIIHTITSDGRYTTRVNGLLVQTAVITSTNNSDADINIGGRSNGGFLYDGDIKSIAMYNEVLTAEEIADIEAKYI